MGFSMVNIGELQKEIERRLDIFDIVAPKMIDATKEIVVNKIKEKAPKSTGELRKSVKASKTKKLKDGAYIATISFKGYDKKTGVPNQIKAAVAEFGRSDLEAKPFIRSATEEAEPEVLSKMQEVFNKEVEG